MRQGVRLSDASRSSARPSSATPSKVTVYSTFTPDDSLSNPDPCSLNVPQPPSANAASKSAIDTAMPEGQPFSNRLITNSLATI